MNRNVQNRVAVMVVLVALGLLIGCAPTANRSAPLGTDGSPKYVFLFIGDGMGLVQAHAAEVYLSAVQNAKHLETRHNADGTEYKWFKPGMERLTINSFPVIGLATTYSAAEQITDSAAAGTALATGRKTSNGTISMDETARLSFTSLAALCKARGMKVGIVSSTSIDDATPAVFYAHQPGRSERQAIDLQLAASPFDYFAGGEMANPQEGQPSPVDLARRQGFRVATTREELAACRPGERVLFQSKTPYELDRPSNLVSLTEMTAKGLALLDNPQGFFMMVESANPDSGSHVHDARVAIGEVLLLDAAVKLAVEFYERHPLETLIIVTSDHETGGMALGCGGDKSDLGLAGLAAQKQSWQTFHTEIFAPYKESHSWASAADNISAELKQVVRERFGLDYEELSEAQKTRLEEAYDASMTLKIAPKTPRNYLLYGSCEPFLVTVSELVSQRAGIGWTTFSHTATPVPVRALGAGAYRFDGYYDNTDVPLRLAEMMRLAFPPPGAAPATPAR